MTQLESCKYTDVFMHQVILEVEADQSMSNETGSLMDRVTVGIISACCESIFSACHYRNLSVFQWTDQHKIFKNPIT